MEVELKLFLEMLSQGVMEETWLTCGQLSRTASYPFGKVFKNFGSERFPIFPHQNEIETSFCCELSDQIITEQIEKIYRI